MLAAYTEDTPLRRVVKPAQAEALAKNKGLQTVGDLLEFVPRAYLPPNQLTDLGELREGEDVMVGTNLTSPSSASTSTTSDCGPDFGVCSPGR